MNERFRLWWHRTWGTPHKWYRYSVSPELWTHFLPGDVGEVIYWTAFEKCELCDARRIEPLEPYHAEDRQRVEET